MFVTTRADHRVWRYIWTKICRLIVEDGKQYAKCRKGFANYFEYLVLGKFIIIRENQGNLSTIDLLGKVLEVAGMILPITFKCGKA